MLPEKNSHLYAARKAANLTMIQLARLLGISETQYWKIEHGYINPSDDDKNRLASVLNVKPGAIF